ncbi:E3 ubiquitin/ISG15 ligase TRIM25-like [Polypterus senegalus]
MAAAKPSVSVDQYVCSLCLEVLKEPVTIPCGHSYCMDCINDCWDQTDTQGGYRCPQCRKTFNVRPELNRNTILAELIENLKEVTAHAGPSQNYAGIGDVPCDVCPGRKRKASKTCLTCMASYCESHLQPHLEFPAFKRHKIDKVTEKLEEKLCGKHQKVLEIFCRTDESCICLLCAATEHKSHDTVTPDVERTGRQSQAENRQAELKTRIEEKEKELEEMKEMVEKIQSSAEKEVQEHEETFNSVLEFLERLRSEVTEVIRDYKSREMRKADEIMERLKKEIEELKTRDTELDELSQTEDHIHFLQKFSSLCAPPEGGRSSNSTLNRDFLPETLRKDLSYLKRSLEEIKGWEFVKTTETGADNPGRILQNLRSRNYLLKYSCPLTLDHNTANRQLRLSEGTKRVTCQQAISLYPEHPDRFDHWQQVLCREALTGARWYWEVEWSGDEVVIGVTYKGIERKGRGKESLFGFNDKSWSFRYFNSHYFFDHNKISTTTTCKVPNSHTIGVFLDCPAGSLSFYNISDTMTLLHSFKTTFTEPLLPGFWIKLNSSVRICSENRLDQ